MTSYFLTSWRQGLDATHPDPTIDAVIKIGSSGDTSPKGGIKYKVEVSGKDFFIFFGTEKVVSYVLFDEVHSECTWESKSDEIQICMTKKSPEQWKSLFRTPLPPDAPVLLTPDKLDAVLQKEIRPFTERKERLTDEDADALLEDILAQKPSHNDDDEEPRGFSMEEEEQRIIQLELKGIQHKLEELTAAPQDDEMPARIAAVTQMKECCLRIEEIRKQTPVTISNMLEVLRLDILKAKLNRGESAEETEEFEVGEEVMSPESLYISGILCLEQRNPSQGLHYLRLAALRKGHTQSTMTLVRLYMESGQQTRSLQLLLNKSTSELEPLSNFTTAQMFDNGVAHFLPSVALAMYFYQRAASCGETSAMCYSSQIFTRGGCIVAKPKSEVIDATRAQQWLQNALERGSVLSYKLMLEQQLEKRGEEAYATAKKYYALLCGTSRELVKTIPQCEERIEQIRKGGSPTVLSAGQLTKPSTSGASQKLSAEERLAQFEERAAARDPRVGMATRTSREQSASDSLRRTWERRTTIFICAGSAYVLSFPLRVMTLPFFFQFLGGVLSMFGRGGSAPQPRGGLF